MSNGRRWSGNWLPPERAINVYLTDAQECADVNIRNLVALNAIEFPLAHYRQGSL